MAPIPLGEAEVAVGLLKDALLSTEVPNAASPEAAIEVRVSVAALVPVAVPDWVEDAAVDDEVGTVDGPVREAIAGRLVSFREGELPVDCAAAGGAVAAVGALAAAMSRV